MADLKYSFCGKPVILFAEPSEEQICPICKELLNCPQQIMCCGQNLCKGCLLEWLQRQRTCPLCRQSSPQYFQDMRNDRAIKNIRGKCAFGEHGCQWTGELRHLDRHLEECTRGIVSCPLRCGQKVEKGHLDEHTGVECPKRQYRCQYCGYEDGYDVVTGTHFHQCNRYPIMCPNTCSAPAFPRCDLERHKGLCPHQEIPCKFADLGCSVVVARVDMGRHCNDTMAYHLNLACSIIVELAGKVKKVQRELQVAASPPDKLQSLPAPVTFAVCWSQLLASGRWDSPVFSTPTPTSPHKFQLRVLGSNSPPKQRAFAVNLGVVFAVCPEPFQGQCSVSLVGFASERDTLTASEVVMQGMQYACGQTLLNLSVELQVKDHRSNMYEDEEGSQHGQRGDMLDSLFGDCRSSITDLHSYVSDDHFAARVDIVPFITGGRYQTSNGGD